MKEVKHFINGEFVGSASGKLFDNINPATGEKIGIVHEAGAPEVDAAVNAARAAMQGDWGRMPLAERANLLHKLADGITARFDEFLEAECLDTGKPQKLACHIDIPRGAANFKIFADVVKNVPTESFMLDTPDGSGA
ncbi:MAG: aldehyde dehydrogenase family protein, partial [Candidatus Thiodiazotropha lotti]